MLYNWVVWWWLVEDGLLGCCNTLPPWHWPSDHHMVSGHQIISHFLSATRHSLTWCLPASVYFANTIQDPHIHIHTFHAYQSFIQWVPTKRAQQSFLAFEPVPSILASTTLFTICTCSLMSQDTESQVMAQTFLTHNIKANYRVWARAAPLWRHTKIGKLHDKGYPQPIKLIILLNIFLSQPTVLQ